jgi:hypothetical protein
VAGVGEDWWERGQGEGGGRARGGKGGDGGDPLAVGDSDRSDGEVGRRCAEGEVFVERRASAVRVVYE